MGRFGKRLRAAGIALGLSPLAAAVASDVVCTTTVRVDAHSNWNYEESFDVSTGTLEPKGFEVTHMQAPASSEIGVRLMEDSRPASLSYSFSPRQGTTDLYTLYTAYYLTDAANTSLTVTLVAADGSTRHFKAKSTTPDGLSGRMGEFNIPLNQISRYMRESIRFEVRNHQQLVHRVVFAPSPYITDMVAWGHEMTGKLARQRYVPGASPQGFECAQREASSTEGCYLTTATVGAVGLSDDCWELRQLRAFRDRFASRNAASATIMDDYYTLAPDVARGVNARADRERIWMQSWAFGILPAAVACQLRLDRVALGIYRVMTRRLQAIASGR